MQKEAFEPTGLIPRSIIRTFDRFLQQLLPGSEGIALQEYRISRYQILVSIQSLLVLVCLPLCVNYIITSFLFIPLTEHFWNSQQTEIFLNAYQEKRAFAEMQDFSEKMFFESLLRKQEADAHIDSAHLDPPLELRVENSKPLLSHPFSTRDAQNMFPLHPKLPNTSEQSLLALYARCTAQRERSREKIVRAISPLNASLNTCSFKGRGGDISDMASKKEEESPLFAEEAFFPFDNHTEYFSPRSQAVFSSFRFLPCQETSSSPLPFASNSESCESPLYLSAFDMFPKKSFQISLKNASYEKEKEMERRARQETHTLQEMFQLKSLQIATRYNQQSILAITHVCADLVTFATLYVLSRVMRAQIIILKSFVIESIYSLSDTTKSFLLILGMDLLVGFHSPRGWEIALETCIRHFGLPENENFILLFVALFPVFLDTVFKYWIFRYLNKISPSTVVTYHSMLE